MTVEEWTEPEQIMLQRMNLRQGTVKKWAAKC